MALGIGVLEATYLVVAGAHDQAVQHWRCLATARGRHCARSDGDVRLPLSGCLPALDSKRPWLVGFITALVILSIPWFAPALVGMAK